MATHKKFIKRLAQIGKVLSKHGFGFIVDELKLRIHIPFFYRIQKYRGTHNNLPKRLRMVMEELGGAYIKLGQLLSLRSDLVSKEYCNEFRKLQDKVPPISFSQVKKTIESEFDEPITKSFAYFSKKPIGSASVAQVHLAKLHNGKKVVVKVQRPDIKDKFDADLETMHFIANKLERKKNFYEFSPAKIVDEVERYTKNELDFQIEGTNISYFYNLFAQSKAAKIPKYYRAYSSKKVLTMDYIEGIKLTNLKKLKNINKMKIANNIFELTIKQVFASEKFHADLHPGNIIVLPDNKIALLDFGIVGGLSENMREQGVRLYFSIIDKDPEEAYNALVHMSTVTKDADLGAFKEEVAEIVDEFNPNARVTHLLHKLLNTCVKYDLYLPSDIILLGKAMVTAEGTCLQLNPDFDFVEKSKPHLKDLFASQWKAKTKLKNIIRTSYELSDILKDLPKKTIAVLQTLEQGKIKVDIADEDLRVLARRVDISGDRISTALVSGSFIVAGALISQVDIGPKYFGIPLIASFSFAIAFLMCFFLIASFFKKEKPFIGKR